MEIYNRKESSGGGGWSWYSKHASAFFKGLILLISPAKASVGKDPWKALIERIYNLPTELIREKAP